MQARTPAQVLAGLLAVTPPGWALPKDPASEWANFLRPMAAEWSRIELAGNGLLAETDPRTCVNLLPDWVRLLGPDPYGRDAAGFDLSAAQTAQLTWARLTETGNMSPSDYIALAASMGVTITIATYWPTIAGLAHAGDLLVNDLPLQAGLAAAGATVGWQHIAFYWLITLPTYTGGLAYAGTAEAGDLVGNDSLDPLPAALLGEAPSHTVPVFRYT